MTFRFDVVTEFVNDRHGGWAATCAGSRTDLIDHVKVKVEGMSSERVAVERAIGRAMAGLNELGRKK